MLRALSAVVLLSLVPTAVRADLFDNYTRPILAKAIDAGSLAEVKELTTETLNDAEQIFDEPGAFVIVRTTEGRYAKMWVQPAARKLSDTENVPLLLVQRFATFRDGTDRALLTQGTNLSVFPSFRFSLDRGEIVPEALGGDVIVERPDPKTRKIVVKPLGKAKLYLVTKALPEATAKKPTRPAPGSKFDVKFFNGTYKLADDGRRFGLLTLKIEDNGDVGGYFISDKDGRKYEVTGKIGSPKHAITFVVEFPMVKQSYTGYLFTGDGKAIAGTAKLLERESGFYATRVDE